MAQAEIKAVITAKDEASAVVSGFGNNVSKSAIAATAAFAVIGTAAIAFGVQSVKAFAESERASTQLDKVLRSTGGAAGVTREAALELADSLMRLTGIDDDAILSAENMLLTFTKLGKDQFPQATKTILDTATAMNGGLKPSAEELRNQTIQLGKALQDPDTGLGALKRVGVNVDELKQKFTDTMPVEEKQRLILQELATEFGGSADKTNSFSDKLLTLQTNFGNLQEKIGGVIAQALSPMLERMNAWIEQNPQAAEKITLVVVAVGTLTAAIWALNTALGVLGGILNGIWGKLGVIAGAVYVLYLQFKAVADVTNGLYDRFNTLGSGVRRTQNDIAGMGGALGMVYGWFLAVDRAAYNFARTVQQLVFSIPVLGGIIKSISPVLPQLRASGGPVTNGAPYIVGEKGPELFVPNSSGTIIPNEKMSGSSTSNTTININVGLMTGSAVERREAAARMFEDLKDIASQKGQTVGQMIGAS